MSSSAKNIEVCEFHGEYTPAAGIAIGGKRIRGSCPRCAAENWESQKKKQEEESAAQFFENRRRHRVEIFEKQIPVRFHVSRFENYRTEDPRQAKAKEIVEKYVDEFGGKIQATGGGLIFAGNPGTGKTHLALAAGRELAQLGQTVAYRNFANLVREIRETWRDDTKSEAEILHYLQNVDLLIVDEIGVQAGSENEKNLFFDIVNGRYENVRPTFVISNCDKKEIQAYIGERVVDRILQGGAIIPFGWESIRGAL